MSYASGKSTLGASKLTNFSRFGAFARTTFLPPASQPACRDSPPLLVESGPESFEPFWNRSIPSGIAQTQFCWVLTLHDGIEPFQMGSNPFRKGWNSSQKGSKASEEGSNDSRKRSNDPREGWNASEEGSNDFRKRSNDSQTGPGPTSVCTLRWGTASREDPKPRRKKRRDD